MTAEADIAALSDGGANPISEIRTALTSTLARADHITGSMSRNSSSQTITASGDTFEFEVEDFDTHGSMVDVANHRFVAPTDGAYQIGLHWAWEGTAPSVTSYLQLLVGGTEAAPLAKGLPSGTFLSREAIWVVQLSASDLVTFGVNTSTSGTTARGNASVHLRTTAWITRLAAT